jgi:putative membrane protein
MFFPNRKHVARGVCVLFAAVGMCWAIPAGAADNAPVPEVKTEKQSDADFLKSVAQIDMAEVHLGKLAEQKSANTDVKSFAQQMERDHAKNKAELKKLAAQMGLKLSKQLDAKHQELMDKLQGLSGKKFDEEYVHAMVEGHKDAVSLFENASKDAQNADVKMFAKNTLPMLQEHLRTAQNTQAKIATEAVDTSTPATSGIGKETR